MRVVWIKLPIQEPSTPQKPPIQPSPPLQEAPGLPTSLLQIYREVDVFNAYSTPYLSLIEGGIKIKYNTDDPNPPQKGELGVYERQGIARVRLGRIENQKTVQVDFEFWVEPFPPEQEGSVEIFEDNVYLPRESIDPIPSAEELRNYRRSIFVYGDDTEKNIFLRPFTTTIEFFVIGLRSITWRYCDG